MMPQPIPANAGNPLQPKAIGYARFKDHDELELLTLRMIRFCESNSLQFFGLFADPGQPGPEDLWGFVGFSGLVYQMARFPTIKKVLIPDLDQITPAQYQALRDVGGDVFVLSAVSTSQPPAVPLSIGMSDLREVKTALRALQALEPNHSRPPDSAAPGFHTADDVPSGASKSAPSIGRFEVTAGPEGPGLSTPPSIHTSGSSQPDGGHEG